MWWQSGWCESGVESVKSHNPDCCWANELTDKTAFLTLLFNDILYIMDSESDYSGWTDHDHPAGHAAVYDSGCVDRVQINENDTFQKKLRRGDLFVEIDPVFPIKLHRSGL